MQFTEKIKTNCFRSILGQEMGEKVGYDSRHDHENNEMGSIDSSWSKEAENDGRSTGFKHGTEQCCKQQTAKQRVRRNCNNCKPLPTSNRHDKKQVCRLCDLWINHGFTTRKESIPYFILENKFISDLIRHWVQWEKIQIILSCLTRKTRRILQIKSTKLKMGPPKPTNNWKSQHRIDSHLAPKSTLWYNLS